MRPLFSALLAAAALLPLSAHAATIDQFTFSGNGLTLSFELPASPVPDSAENDFGFFVDDLPYLENGKKMVAGQAFFPIESINGGFILLDRDGDLIENFSFNGPQVFSGAATSPTFVTGSYTLNALFCPGSDPDDPTPADQCNLTPYQLQIAPASAETPEPGSLALLDTGALGVFGVVRRTVRS